MGAVLKPLIVGLDLRFPPAPHPPLLIRAVQTEQAIQIDLEISIRKRKEKQNKQNTGKRRGKEYETTTFVRNSGPDCCASCVMLGEP